MKPDNICYVDIEVADVCYDARPVLEEPAERFNKLIEEGYGIVTFEHDAYYYYAQLSKDDDCQSISGDFDPILDYETILEAIKKFNDSKKDSPNLESRDSRATALRKKFEREYKELAEYYEGLPIDDARTKFECSLRALLKLKPDKISLELSYERSIYYTLIKGEYTFFMQHFLDDLNEDEDEVILVVFKNNNKLPSYGGLLDVAIVEIENIIASG